MAWLALAWQMSTLVDHLVGAHLQRAPDSHRTLLPTEAAGYHEALRMSSVTVAVAASLYCHRQLRAAQGARQGLPLIKQAATAPCIALL
jgi:hypothetical protein